MHGYANIYESLHDHKHAHICVCTYMSAQTHACMYICMYAYMNVTVCVHVHAHVLQCIQALTCSKCLALGCLSLATARPSGSAWQSPPSWLHPRNDYNGAFFVEQISNEITGYCSGSKEAGSLHAVALGRTSSSQPPQSPRRQIWTVWLQKWSSENGTKCMSFPLACWKMLY